MALASLFWLLLQSGAAADGMFFNVSFSVNAWSILHENPRGVCGHRVSEMLEAYQAPVIIPSLNHLQSTTSCISTFGQVVNEPAKPVCMLYTLYLWGANWLEEWAVCVKKEPASFQSRFHYLTQQITYKQSSADTNIFNCPSWCIYHPMSCPWICLFSETHKWCTEFALRLNVNTKGDQIVKSTTLSRPHRPFSIFREC